MDDSIAPSRPPRCRTLARVAAAPLAVSVLAVSLLALPALAETASPVRSVWAAASDRTAAAGGDASPARCVGSARGRLVAVTDLQLVTRDEAATALRSAGLATGATHGVRMVRLTYCTVVPSGASGVASGLLVVPQNASGALPTVVYAHGTVTARADAPSFLGTTEGRLAPLVFAAEGFVVAAPDYLGLGLSPVTHPFLHAATEASAAVDLLRAARQAGARLAVRLSGDVFASGHSQGGHATMAIGRRLAEIGAGGGGWRLRALAPMAGPYDLSGIALPAALDATRTDPAIATAYLAYLLISWKSLYHLYSEPREVFAAPYADTVPALFDGTHSLPEIADVLPDSPSQLFRPEALATMAHPSGRLAAALRDNDVCRWAPAVPTRLYVGRADRDVVPEHTHRCRQQLAAHGSSARVSDVGDVDHIGTALAALPLIRAWFMDLRGR